MYVEARERLVDWLGRQLIGPARDDEDQYEIGTSPLARYPVGVLHPQASEHPPIDAMSEGKEERGLRQRETGDDVLSPDEAEDEAPPDGQPGAVVKTASPIRRRPFIPPSSVGFTFCVRGDPRLRIRASAAVYKQKRDSSGRFVDSYERSVLEPASIGFEGPKPQRNEIWADPRSEDSDRPQDPRGSLDVWVRPHGPNTFVTVTLFNRQHWDSGDAVEESLFEVGLECIVEQGEVIDYPRIDPSLMTDEERELELQYRKRRIYAVGHGTAVDWDNGQHGPQRIWSDFLPRVVTPIVSIEPRGEKRVLEMQRLSADRLPLEDLLDFVGEYETWVSDQLRESEKGRDDREAARRITARMTEAKERMLRGVAMLETEPDARLAFRLANRAMLRQMTKSRGQRATPLSWRPFQLGFLLATIESTAFEMDDHRDVLDLIWFQTGGGKTEAYLGLIAFLLVWRRLRYGEYGGGTAAFMRYTLRLLTRQQFERAARVICALELLRRDRIDTLGEEPFSVGIWVGAKVTPNWLDTAKELVERIQDGDHMARSGMLIADCPWCKERLDPHRGYRVWETDFRFHCTNQACAFGQSGEPLPCQVVDESLYEHPPSLLIATIDKFAQLAWQARSSAFLGVRQKGRPGRRAPDLVLQDELHLISGPLGSIAGLYEAGIETAIECRGVRPKYIASTATIRMAKEQVRALYGRDIAVFPPPGLSCDDSWFARTDCRTPGRMYVGYLAPHSNKQDSFAVLAATLLAAPLICFGDEQDAEALFEAWWTSVVYHGSLRGVADSSNAFASDVREFGLRLIEEHREEMGTGANGDETSRKSIEELKRRFRDTEIEQLWSRRTADEIGETYKRLAERKHGEKGCLDTVLATNMVSVGLDVSRLALMVVNGQPLTTGEYVQATSRVGRSEVPGIVVANYHRHQARSLSCYESFRPYHDSFYRFVEPSSTTPFTFQVRKRALHAALVIAMRHGCEDLRAKKAARDLDPKSPGVRKVVAALKRRIGEACPEEKRVEVARHLDDLLLRWQAEAERCRQASRGLHYRASDKSNDQLLYANEYGVGRPGLWMTMLSMRNVETPAVLKIG